MPCPLLHLCQENRHRDPALKVPCPGGKLKPNGKLLLKPVRVKAVDEEKAKGDPRHRHHRQSIRLTSIKQVQIPRSHQATIQLRMRLSIYQEERSNLSIKPLQADHSEEAKMRSHCPYLEADRVDPELEKRKSLDQLLEWSRVAGQGAETEYTGELEARRQC